MPRVFGAAATSILDIWGGVECLAKIGGVFLELELEHGVGSGDVVVL